MAVIHKALVRLILIPDSSMAAPSGVHPGADQRKEGQPHHSDAVAMATHHSACCRNINGRGSSGCLLYPRPQSLPTGYAQTTAKPGNTGNSSSRLDTVRAHPLLEGLCCGPRLLLPRPSSFLPSFHPFPGVRPAHGPHAPHRTGTPCGQCSACAVLSRCPHLGRSGWTHFASPEFTRRHHSWTECEAFVE